jgi:hypothetical protein
MGMLSSRLPAPLAHAVERVVHHTLRPNTTWAVTQAVSHTYTYIHTYIHVIYPSQHRGDPGPNKVRGMSAQPGSQ